MNDGLFAGFVVIPTVVFRDTSLSERSKLLYGHIFSRTPALIGAFYTAIGDMARAIDATTVQTNRCLTELEVAGYILVQRGARDGRLGDVFCEIQIGLRAGVNDEVSFT